MRQVVVFLRDWKAKRCGWSSPTCHLSRSRTIRSKILAAQLSREMGRMVPRSLGLGIWVIEATFHGVGGDPASSDILKMVRSSALSVAPR